MLTMQVSNFDKFVDHISNWVDEVEQEVADVANGLTVEIFHQVLLTSPQYSGDFAGSWKYSINRIDTSFEPLNLTGLDEGKVFKVGARPAIDYAIAENKGKDKDYKLGDTFYLSNSAEHDDNYAVLIERGLIAFRPGHEGATAHGAVVHVGGKYANISRRQADTLKRIKL